MAAEFQTLVTRAEPDCLRFSTRLDLLREYEEICGVLSAGKTRGVAARIADIERYRAGIVQRITQITDYLNWYEATQTPGRSGAFDQYMRRADELSKPPTVPRDARITNYLDQLEQDFAPVRPEIIPGVGRAGR